MTTSTVDKVHENRIRRMAERQGYMLVKSRRRDRRAEDFGLYVLAINTAGNRHGRHGGQEAVSAFANGEGVTLDAIEGQLTADHLTPEQVEGGQQ